MKKFVQSYGIPNDNKAYLALGITAIVEIAAILLIHANLGLLGWGIHTLNCVRIFVQFHDMAHFSFFSDMSKNIFFGKIFGVYVHFPFNAWRDGHNHHHKHFGNLDRFDASQTILFTKKQYEAMSLPKKILVRVFR
jgi:fatty acid desaturase